MANPTTPEEEVSTSETNLLEEVLALEPCFYKRPIAYEFSNGRKFEEGLGPYGP